MGYAHRACCCNEGPGPPETCDECIDEDVTFSVTVSYETIYTTGVTWTYTYASVSVDMVHFGLCEFGHSGTGSGEFQWTNSSPFTGCPTDDSCQISAWPVPPQSALFGISCGVRAALPAFIEDLVTTPTYWAIGAEPMPTEDGFEPGCECSPIFLGAGIAAVVQYYDRSVADPRLEDWSTPRATRIYWYEPGLGDGHTDVSGDGGTVFGPFGSQFNASMGSVVVS